MFFCELGNSGFIHSCGGKVICLNYFILFFIFFIFFPWEKTFSIIHGIFIIIF